MQYDELQCKIHSNGLGEWIVLEGGKSNPYPYIKNADIYVHTSYIESQGLTILEAMALGVPCVVIKSAGPCEFLVDEENALLVEKNEEALYQQVIRMLTDEELYNSIKDNTICPDRYKPERVMKKIYDVLS